MSNPVMHAKLLAAATRAGLENPSWETALLFPNQGQWSEGDFLALPSNHLVELSDGRLEVLPMPTLRHQEIVFFLALILKQWFAANRPGGRVVVAPYPVRLWQGKLREPDIVCLLPEHAARCGEQFADGADLLIEVVSQDDPKRDKEVKRREYAQAGVLEYWIADAQAGTITVLCLSGGEYREHGKFGHLQEATSLLLPGVVINVSAALTAH